LQLKATKPRKVIESVNKAIPSPTHMAFVKLIQEDVMKFLVSQNVDGLHRRSGIPTKKISELHGNSNLEKCEQCGKEYMRDYDTYAGYADHSTGRTCDNMQCGGRLRDTIINFGENLNTRILNKAFEHGSRADLCLSMGSSLRVTPAA
jgi:NAD-dependent SIR2 family protein deacetylase